MEHRTLPFSDARRIAGVERARATEIFKDLCAQLGPFVRIEKRGRQKLLVLEHIAFDEPQSLAVGVAACFASAVAALVRGTAVEQSLVTATKHAIRATGQEAKFANMDRKFLFRLAGGDRPSEQRSHAVHEIALALMADGYLQFEYREFDGVSSDDIIVAPWSLVIIGVNRRPHGMSCLRPSVNMALQRPEPMNL